MWIVVAILALSVVAGKWLRSARIKHQWPLIEN